MTCIEMYSFVSGDVQRTPKKLLHVVMRYLITIRRYMVFMVILSNTNNNTQIYL